MTEEDKTTANENDDGSRLLNLVRSISIKPSDAKALVAQKKKQIRSKFPNSSENEICEKLSNLIIRRYSRMASFTGGTTALTGVIPGLGTILASVGGATADTAVCMKFQVDMCMCLTENYGYDICSEDAQHLSLLIAGGGAIEKAGSAGVTKIASNAGVKMLKEYLKGATLQAVKAFFKKIGIVFSRKALEKAIPFGVGVVISSATNYAFTRYVGKQAKKWFEIDKEMSDEPNATCTLEESPSGA